MDESVGVLWQSG